MTNYHAYKYIVKQIIVVYVKGKNLRLSQKCLPTVKCELTLQAEGITFHLHLQRRSDWHSASTTLAARSMLCPISLQSTRTRLSAKGLIKINHGNIMFVCFCEGVYSHFLLSQFPIRGTASADAILSLTPFAHSFSRCHSLPLPTSLQLSAFSSLNSMLFTLSIIYIFFYSLFRFPDSCKFEM